MTSSVIDILNAQNNFNGALYLTCRLCMTPCNCYCDQNAGIKIVKLKLDSGAWKLTSLAMNFPGVYSEIIKPWYDTLIIVLHFILHLKVMQHSVHIFKVLHWPAIKVPCINGLILETFNIDIDTKELHIPSLKDCILIYKISRVVLVKLKALQARSNTLFYICFAFSDRYV